MKIIPFTIPVAKETTVMVQEDQLPHFYNHLHRHPELQLTWVQEGTGILITGSHTQRFQPGDVYLIGANQPHLFKSDAPYFAADSTLGVRALSFFFNPTYLAHTLLQLPELTLLKKWVSDQTPSQQVPTEQVPAVTEAMIEVQHRQEGPRVAAFIQLLHRLAQLPAWQVLSPPTSGPTITDTEGTRMDRIFQYLVAHYQQPVSLAAIAEVANLTPQAFCRYFKKHTDKTFVSFLNEMRISEACKLILSGQFASFAEVAYQTGFENVTHFNRVFKKCVGQSPRAFQRDFYGKVG